jgi:hypothetical protein
VKPTAATTPGSTDRLRTHLLVLPVLVVLSVLFYARALDNGFWHAEDFRMLATVQRLVADPSQLLRLDAIQRHHPVPLALFFVEYKFFGLEPLGYYLVNLLLHGLNAWLVYWLVTALLADRRIAILSGVLFALGVGSYGKAVMFVAGSENLLITLLYLLLLNLYIRNDLYGRGKLLSGRYLMVLLLFLLVSFAKPTAFSLVGGLLAYKVFFRGERGSARRIFEPHLLILIVGAVLFWLARVLGGVSEFGWSMAGSNPWSFSVNFVKNMINYIIHMFFPMHVSRLVETGNPVVQFVYSIAPLIRFLIGLSIVSYSVFGFIFGNRTLRFFLAWTFISVLPYCVVRFPVDWLNIRYLYQVSIGFVFIMASGTILSMDLLYRRRWRRLLPLVVPFAFVLLSSYVTDRLDLKYESEAQQPEPELLLQSLQGSTED